MRRIVFYSWQSDLPAKCNRSFIEAALKRALKAIRKDSSHALEPVFDRDTAGQAGSPSISESIFSKISLSDLFIADVSIVNKFERRAHPNPNVLIEIGYAAAELGWSRIVLIQNTAFGSPDELPFDLRGRRIITYNTSNNEKLQSEERGLLQGRLEGEIRLALDETAIGGLPSGPNSAVWWGEWRRGEIDLESGSLFIRDIGTSGFYFELSVSNGAHSGTAAGYARLVSRDTAYATLVAPEAEQSGEILFRRELTERHRIVSIEETKNCQYFRGARAVFGGKFTRLEDPWLDSGLLNEIELNRIFNITKRFYNSIRIISRDTFQIDNIDDFPAKGIGGGVPGFYGIYESVVLLADNGSTWAAYNDAGIVRYFTNTNRSKEHIPKTIKKWLLPFGDVRFSTPRSIEMPSLDT